VLCVDESPFDWKSHEEYLSEKAFQRRYRVTKEGFNQLVTKEEMKAEKMKGFH
jgi:hypothetical protein